MSIIRDLLTLADGARDGRFELARGAVGWLDAVLDPFCTDRLVIENAVSRVSAGSGALFVTGDVRPRFPDAPCRATLRVTVEDGAPSALLRLDVVGPQTIEALFGAQPPSIIAGPDGYLMLSTESVIAKLVVSDASFTSGTLASQGSFTGNLQVDQKIVFNGQSVAPFAAYTPLPIAPAVSLAGKWSGLQTPRFTLYGASDAALTMPGFVSGSGIVLSNELIDQNNMATTPTISGAQFFVATDLFGGATLTAPLLYSDAFWLAQAIFDAPGASIADAAAAIASLLGAEAGSLLTMPPGFDLPTAARLRLLEIGIEPASADDLLPTVRHVRIVITFDEHWSPPIPLIDTVENVGFSLLYAHANDPVPSLLTGGVFGTMVLGKGRQTGDDSTQLSLDIGAALPQFDLSLSQTDGTQCALGPFLSNVFDQPDVIPASWNLTLTKFDAAAQMAEREFHAFIQVDGKIDLVDERFTLDELSARIDVSQSGADGSLEGIFTIAPGNHADPTMGPIRFAVGAAYAGQASDWVFTGSLAQMDSIHLFELVGTILDIPVPDWLKPYDTVLSGLSFSYGLGEGHPYAISGALGMEFNLKDALGYDLAIAVSGHAERAPGATSASGFLRGGFALGDLLVSAQIGFGGAGDQSGSSLPAYAFRVAWGAIEADAITAVVTDDPDDPDYDGGKGTHTEIRIALVGVTLGDIVSRMIAIVDPNVDVALDAPWSALNDIDLSRAHLRIDPKYARLAVDIDVGLNLGFMQIDSIGVRYDGRHGAGRVHYELQGNFLGTDYGGGNPLIWDAISGSPPTTPGTGNSVLDLRYFGIGQRIAIDYKGTTIAGAVAAMEQVLRPADPDGDGVPIPAGVFDPGGGWTIGLDATILRFINLQMVFDDPSIYGIRVGLSGEQAKSLSGLEIELSYRQVTSSVGVFHTELTLPDAYRQFELGAVSVTLGIVSVDIYTDGGFEIDLGFPRGRDYTRAFSVEAGPFIGRGGIYFGVLQSGASSRAPQITNGRFAPVIEAGVGIAAGLGRDFHKGPLSAGLSIEVEAMFEGVVAWFHPTDESLPNDTYYYCRATAAIVGQLYGSVDFGIISASLMVVIQASATLTLEAYRATLVLLDVDVSVEAEVHFLFCHISFSFDMELEASFVIGNDTAAPWILANGATGSTPARIDQIWSRPLRRALPGAGAHATNPLPGSPIGSRDRATDGYILNWQGGKVLLYADSKPRNLYATIAPGLTRAAPPVEWGPTMANPSVTDDAAIVFLVTSTPDPTAPDAGDSFSRIAETMLRWSLLAVGQPAFGGAVDVGELSVLAAQIQWPQAARDISFAALDMMLGRNLYFNFAASVAAAGVSGAVLPMPPLIERATGDGGSPVDYASINIVTAAYETALGAWLAGLRPGVGATLATPHPPRAGAAGESFPTMIFRDYFLMVAKAVVAEAESVANNWSITIQPAGPVGSATLAQVALGFAPKAVPYVKGDGDTIDHAAASFGLSADELAFRDPGVAGRFASAHPGDTLTFIIGVTPQSIAADNGLLAFGAATTCDLAPIPVQTHASDSLATLAGGQDRVSDWLAAVDPVHAIAASTRLLKEGSTLALPGFVWAGGADCPPPLQAPILYVRLTDYADGNPAAASAMATLIGRLNAELRFDANGCPVDPLPPTIVAPADPLGTTKRHWPTYVGDTLHRLSAAMALALDPTAATGFAAFAAALANANPDPVINPPPRPVVLPPGSVTTILAGESLVMLAERLLLAVSDPLFAAMAGPATILAPLQVVVAPSFYVPVAAGTTLQALAMQYGLSLEDLGERIADHDGLLPPGTVLTISQATSLPTEALIAQTLSAKAIASISGQVSRFMMHGMRIPTPRHDGTLGPLAAMFDLNGQMAPLAAVALPGGQGYGATFTVPELRAREWLNSPGDSFSVTASMSLAQVAASLPATELKPDFTDPAHPATALPLTAMTAVHWDLTQRLLWLVPDWPLTMLGAAPAKSGTPPSLWPLPSALLTHLRVAPNDARFHLCQIDAQAQPGTPHSPVSTWLFGTMIELSIRTTSTPQTYELIGATSDQRDTLLQLWQALAMSGSSADVFVLYEPAVATGAPAGFASLALANTAEAPSFVVKANLSTVTAAGDLAAAIVDPAPFAVIGDPVDFLRLVWECSTVGGGYWLQLATTDHQGVPAAIFDTSGRGKISLLVAVPTIADPAMLAPWHNVVVVGDPVDPASTHVFLSDANRAFDRPVAVMEPGKAGYAMTLHPPSPPAMLADAGQDDAAAQARLRQLFQLVGYRIAENAGFFASDIALPTGPQMVKNDPDWHFGATVPIHRLSKLASAPLIAGVPDPLADPYAGIGYVQGAGGVAVPATAALQLWFQDVFGNTTASAPTAQIRGATTASSERSGVPMSATDDGVLTIALPSAYSDPVTSIAQWPSTLASFVVAGTVASPRIDVSIQLQMSVYAPAPSQLGSMMTSTFAKHMGAYGQAWYQLHRPDMTGLLHSSLMPLDGDGGQPQPLSLDLAPLRSYVGGVWSYLSAASALVDAPLASDSTTISAIGEHYGVDFDDLAAVNGDLSMAQLFEPTASPPHYPVPIFVLWTPGATVAKLCKTAPATVLAAVENADLALNPGIEIAIPNRPLWIQPPSGDNDNSLRAAAAAAKCSCSALAGDNADRPVLAGGFRFVVGSLAIVAEPLTTLRIIASQFTARGVPISVSALAAHVADVPGLFRVGVEIAVQHYLVQPGETLASNGGATQALLAPLNGATVDLFAAGTPVFDFAADAGLQADAALTTIAKVYGASVEQILAYNADTTLAQPTPLRLPGNVLLPTTAATLRVPYRIRPDDSFALLHDLFDGAEPQTVVGDNFAVGATLVANMAVTYNGQTVHTGPADSFAMLAGRFAGPPTAAEIAGAIAAVPHILAKGAMLMMPIPVHSGPATTIAALAQLYGVDAQALALANAGLGQWLMPGAVFQTCDTAGKVIGTYTLPGTVGAPSPISFAGIVSAFKAQGITTTVGQIARDNLTTPNAVSTSARFLLPPPPLGMSLPLATTGAPQAALFEITTTLTLARDPGLVCAGMEDGPVAQSVAEIAPRPDPIAGTGTLSFASFAATLQRILPTLRVAAGRIDPTAPQRAHLWAVAFGPGGLAEVSVPPTPQFLALRPLYPQPVSRPAAALATPTLPKQPKALALSNVDADVWAQAFLADIDVFLGSNYATAAFLADRAGLQRVIDAKLALAASVAAGLEAIFLDGAEPLSPDAIASARETLRQSLLDRLASAWDMNVMLQYPVATTAPAGQTAIRLPLAPADTAPASATVLSGDKIDFASSASFLNIAATTAQRDETWVDLAPVPQIKTIEFDIQTVIGLDYQRSQWLAFLDTPLAATPPPGWRVDLGTPRAPVPARDFADQPQLVSQSAVIDPHAPAGWQGAGLWQFGFAFAHSAAPQDQILFGAAFNNGKTPITAAAADPGLFEALANYQAQRSAIWADLDPAQPIATQKAAIEAFAAQVEAVGTQWAAHWKASTLDRRLGALYRFDRAPDAPKSASSAGQAAPAPHACGYVGTLRHAVGRYTSLDVERMATAASIDWPSITLNVADQIVPLERSVIDDHFARYIFPDEPAVAPGATIEYHVGLGGLHVASRQDAVAAVSIARNAELLGPDGPPTREDFVYRATPVVFAAPIAPRLTYAAAFDGGDWSADGPATLGRALATMLVDGTDQLTTLAIEARFVSDAIAPSRPLRSPVFYTPQVAYASGIVDDIAARLQVWATASPPPGGRWELTITAFGTLPDATAQALLIVPLAFETP